MLAGGAMSGGLLLLHALPLHHTRCASCLYCAPAVQAPVSPDASRQELRARCQGALPRGVRGGSEGRANNRGAGFNLHGVAWVCTLHSAMPPALSPMQAYEILSDDARRAEYDSGRWRGAGSDGGFAGPTRHAHAEEVFRMFFGGQDPFAGIMRMMAGGSPFDGSGGFGGGGGSGMPGPAGMGGSPMGGFSPMMGAAFAGGIPSGFPPMMGGGMPYGFPPMMGGGPSGFPPMGGMAPSGFPPMMRSSSSFMSMSSSSGFTGVSTTSSTSTSVDQWGRTISRTTTTKRYPDGRTESSEEVTCNGMPITSDGRSAERLGNAPSGSRVVYPDSSSGFGGGPRLRYG